MLNRSAFEKRKKAFSYVRDTFDDEKHEREEKNLQFFVGGLVRLALSEDDDRKEKKNCRQKEEKKNQLAGQGPKD